MSVDETAWVVPPPANQPTPASRPAEVIQSPSPASLDVIMGLWVTKADESSRKVDGISYSLAPTRPATPNDMSPGTVDERYRDDLSKRLRPRWKEEPLPSTKFLVCSLIFFRSITLIWVQNFALLLFFTRFNPIFPILYALTFRPNKHNSLLLLSICSIGCLFMGSNGASAQGSRIFKRLNKIILASVFRTHPSWLTKNS